MKTKEEIRSMNEIVFENRNKNYGAYELRVNYERRVFKSMSIAYSVFFVVFLLLFITRETRREKNHLSFDEAMVFTEPLKTEIFPEHVQQKTTSSLPVQKQPVNNIFLAVRDSMNITEKTDSNVLVTTDTSGILTAGTGNVNNPDTLEKVVSEKLPVTLSVASVDKIPEFPGGIERFYKYLLNRIRYTDEARDVRLKGRLYVSFVIDRDGLLCEIELMNKIGYGMEEEVQKVLLESPKWSPGFVSNHAVKTRMVLPVSFNIVQ